MGDIIKTAQCRFCGQMVQIETDKELTQPQAEEQARKRAEWLYMILRDCTPVIADLHTSKAQVVTESMVIKYVPENYTMDGIRCDIAIGFGQLGKIIATENTCDNLMDERELAKYIVDNETISENENIECRR